MGFCHIYHLDGLKDTLLFQGFIPEMILAMGMVGRMYIPRTGERVRSPQLPGASLWVNQWPRLLEDLLQKNNVMKSL